MRTHRVVAACALALMGSLGAASARDYQGALAGSNEVPPTASIATGYGVVTYDEAATLGIDLTFNGLTAVAVAGHIHCCTLTPGTNVGVAVPFPGLPPATSGSYQHVFNLDDPAVYSSTFLNANGATAAGAKAALIAGMENGHAYLNVHTSTFPGGEIRADLLTTIFRNGFD